MKFKKGIAVLIILQIIFLSGCWDSREINKLALSICVGIDKSEEGYIITHQILNPSNIASEKAVNYAPVILYYDTGEDIFEIFRKLTTQSPRKIYVSHIRMVIFGQKVAEEGIEEIIDFFARDHEFRTDFYFAVAKNRTAKDILNILTPLEIMPGIKMYDSLETSEKVWAPTKLIRIIELMNDITSEGKNPVITGIEIKHREEESNSTDVLKQISGFEILNYTSLGVFKKDKLVGWLNETESKGYNYITGNVRNTVGHLYYDGNKAKITCESKGVKSKIKTSLINNRPVVDVEIKIKVNIGAIEGDFDPTSEKQDKLMNNLVEKRIESICNQALNKAQNQLKTDIFGFGEAISRKYPELWENLKYDWDDEFSNLPVNITIHAETKQMGQFTKPFYIEE